MKVMSKTTWMVGLLAGAMLLSCATTSAATDAQARTQILAKAKDPKDQKDQKEKKKKKKKFKKKIKIIRKHGPGAHWAAPMKKRGFLGVHLLELTAELREHFKVPANVGVMVSKVSKDSPAQKAGFQAGDILAEVDGEEVAGSWEAVRLIGKKKKGDKANIKVFRQGKALTLIPVIEEKSKPQMDVGKFLHKVYKPGSGGEEEIEIVLDQDQIDNAVEFYEQSMQQAQEMMEDTGEKRMKIFKFREFENEEMEKRLKQMEKRLKELEKKLQSKLSQPKSKRPA